MTAKDAIAGLAELRASIDNIDAALVHLLAERFKLTKQVGVYKAANDLPPPIASARSSSSPACTIWPGNPISIRSSPRNSMPSSPRKSSATTRRCARDGQPSNTPRSE